MHNLFVTSLIVVTFSNSFSIRLNKTGKHGMITEEGEHLMTQIANIPNNQSTDALAQCFALQPSLTRDAAAFSLALSASAYHMHTVPWQDAGWMDFSFQVDHTLMTGAKVNASQGVQGKLSRMLNRIARHRLHRSDPFSQLYGALRQRDRSDTCKALVMAHPLTDGRYLIAIGFMGTGKRLFDWISNFRLSKAEHMHRGFLQLAEEFESRTDEICFPQIAREMQLPHLTLKAILEECTRDDSRFLIWMSGHSQGGAVMQVFTHHMLTCGVLPDKLLGVGFASPTVLHEGCMFPHYPLHHLICADDLTPRIGAKRHLGCCHVLPMTDHMRAFCYGNAPTLPGFEPLLFHLSRIPDTREALLFAMGLLRALGHVSDQEAGAVLTSLVDMNMPDLLIDWLGDGVSRIMMMISARLARSYRHMTGEANPPRQALRQYERVCLSMMRAYTPRGFAAALARVLAAPHRLQGKNGALSAYQMMTGEYFSLLRRMDMLPGAWPVLTLPMHSPRRKPHYPRRGRLHYSRTTHG